MNRSNERPSLRTMASEDIKKLCTSDYKRFYGLRTDIRELVHAMLEIHHEMKLQNKGGAV
jgi:hypothetical protein